LHCIPQQKNILSTLQSDPQLSAQNGALALREQIANFLVPNADDA